MFGGWGDDTSEHLPAGAQVPLRAAQADTYGAAPEQPNGCTRGVQGEDHVAAQVLREAQHGASCARPPHCISLATHLLRVSFLTHSVDGGCRDSCREQGVVEPYGAVAVTVIMQQQKEWPSDAAMCKDKFLVQTVAVGAGASQQPDDLAALFSEESGARVTQTKLKVRTALIDPELSTRQPP